MVEEAVAPSSRRGGRTLDGHPVDKMLEGEREKLLRMEDERSARRVIGQEEAVTARSRTPCGGRVPGLNDPNRPMGSFLFLGPTGVGKTELTKAWPNFLFDDDSAMVRIDMSEFMEKARRRPPDRRAPGLCWL